MSKLFSIYLWIVGLSNFVCILIAAIVFSVLLPARIYDPWLKGMLRSLFKILFIPVQVEGREIVRKGRTYMFMSNHASIFDMPLLAGFLPGMVRGVEATRQFNWPLYGLVMRRMGNIPINRENVFAAMKSLILAEKKVLRRCSLIILPEGHRTLDGKLRSFKRLPFYLAKRARVDLVPVGISGLFGLKSKKTWIIRPKPIKIKFGKIISAEQIHSLSVSALRDLTRDRIKNLVERP